MPDRRYEQDVVVTRGPALRWDAAGWGRVVRDAHHALAVRELTAVAGSERFGTTDPPALAESLRIASEGMLSAVAGRRHGTALELRYVTEPRDGRSTRVRLFITGKSVGDTSSEPLRAAAATTVQAACAALPDGYEWQPAGPDDAEPPFDSPTTLVEVRRQEEVLPPLRHSVPAEFYYAAYPLQGDGSGWGQFLRTLARATQRVAVSLLFAPTALDQRERDAIGAVTSELHFYADARQEYSHRGFGYAHGDANAAAVLPVWEHYMQSLRRSCLLVRMTVRGPADTARVTAKALAGALSASRAGGSRSGSPLTTQGIRSDRDQEWASHSWTMRDVVPWGGHQFWDDDGAPNTLRRLPYLYSLAEAAAAAMLPVPKEDGADGFPAAQLPAGGRTSRNARQVIIQGGGVFVAGDQYNVGQAGAVGRGARAGDVTFATGAGFSGNDDSTALGAELQRLRVHLEADADDRERAAALDIVAQAERTAKEGDRKAAIEQLSALRRRGNTGRWALATATTIGTTVAAAALSAALGL
jgi:hypothetical protein